VYHLLLTRRYLTTKILPFLATAAVFLSTATVIIAWSIMTGFLGVLLNSGRTLVGDVIIAWPSAGFGYYDELIADLENDPAITAATPVIEVLGVIKLPDNRIRPASVKGIEPRSFARVAGYDKSLWWYPLDKPLPKDVLGQDPRLVDVKPLVEVLKTMLPSFRANLEHAADLARQRSAPPERVATLAALPQRLASLAPAADAALALPAGSSERRDAIVAFLNDARAFLKDAGENTQALRAADILSTDDLHVPEGSQGALLGDSLIAFQNTLAPIYAEYMRLADAYQNGRDLRVTDPDTGDRVPAMLIGIEFTNYNQRFPEGYYIPKRGLAVRRPDGTLAPIPSDMLGRSLTLNVLPLDSSPSQFDLVSRAIPIANELRSGLFEFDKSWVIADLQTIQSMVRLQAAEEVAPFDPYAVHTGPEGESLPAPKVIRKTPARVTHVLVRGSGSLALPELRKHCETIYAAFSEKHPADVPSSSLISITTWEEEQSTLVGAVKKEIVMVLLILGVVSLTVSFLILAIFWAIVREKTKDIGILRAVGASRWSVCGLWLEYALVTGILGSLLGGLAGCLIVWNINPIHDWLGRTLGLVIWDPRIYYFFEIPNKVDPLRAALVMVAGTVFAVLGALIPAIRAAFMDPVKSLRFE
jgi:ABC-type lipoprotein release transport system permease subunit